MKTLKDYRDVGCNIEALLKCGDKIDIELAAHLISEKQNSEDLEEWDEGYIQDKNLADIVAGGPIFDTIYRRSKYEPFTYMGQCRHGSMVNLNPKLSRKIYVCSRYRAESSEELDHNIEVARSYCKRIAQTGNIPIAPHLYFPQFSNDNNRDEREFGMQCGMMLMKEADRMFVVIENEVISEGMEAEMKYAANILGIPINIEYLQSKEV